MPRAAGSLGSLGSNPADHGCYRAEAAELNSVGTRSLAGMRRKTWGYL